MNYPFINGKREDERLSFLYYNVHMVCLILGCINMDDLRNNVNLCEYGIIVDHYYAALI